MQGRYFLEINTLKGHSFKCVISHPRGPQNWFFPPVLFTTNDAKEIKWESRYIIIARAREFLPQLTCNHYLHYYQIYLIILS